MSDKSAFYRVLTAAIEDFAEHGFDSQWKLDLWVERLRRAAGETLVPESELRTELTRALEAAYRRALEPSSVARAHPEVGRFTVQRLGPKLRSELDRRIMASANLIRLNREESKDRTLRRFAGWATSVPAGGLRSGDRRKVKREVYRGISGLPFEERRVVVDQGHKLAGAVNDIIAENGGAIAARWRHVRERGKAYEPRPEHVERDGHVLVLRGNWALERGLMKTAGRQYTDGVELPGELVYCRCWYEYLYTLGELPKDMLTSKGRAALEAARAEVKRLEYRGPQPQYW